MASGSSTLERSFREDNNRRGLSFTDLGQGSHNIDVPDLGKSARKRLKEIKLDEYEELYSLRLTGKERVFGIKDRDTLRLIWYDPEHQVCPSPKKNT